MNSDSARLYEKLQQEIKLCPDTPSECLTELAENLWKTLRGEPDAEFIERMERELLTEAGAHGVYMNVYLLSLLIQVNPTAELVDNLLELAHRTEVLNYRAKNFLFYQIEKLVFMNPRLETKEVLWKKWELLEQVKKEAMRELAVTLAVIPPEARNQKLTLVITEQFLEVQHAPTKVALDRCALLKKVLGEEVLLINTAEAFAKSGTIWFVGAVSGIYKAEKCQEKYQYWEGEQIPYLQCENQMPDIDVMTMLLETVKSLKPGMVIHIGGSSLVAGLIDEMIPVLTIGTTQSGIVPTLTRYQTAQGMKDSKWNWVLQKMGKEKGHVIPAKFTFSFEKQQEITTRRKQGLPEEMFLLFTVGNRLDEEVTDAFLDMLESVLSEKIGMVFIGPFDKFELRAKEHPAIRPYLYCLGWCSDLFSRMELCDLYVNPLRKGGGTSAVMAMCKGKPAISTDYGDVAGFIGTEFCCKDYKEMAEEILTYAKDAAWYAKQSARALQIADEYLDTAQEFKRVISEYRRLQLDA